MEEVPIKTLWDKITNYAAPNSQSIDLIDDKIIYVYWSGGCDSTALLHCLAKQYPNKIIKAISLYSACASRDKDEKARIKLKKQFKIQGIENIEYLDFKLYEKGISGECHYGLGQPVLWLMSLPEIIFHENIAVCFAYVLDDAIWHYIQPFKLVFHNIVKIVGARNVTLHFPLEMISKLDILSYLIEHKLLDYCNYCESESKKSYNVCGSCIRHNAAYNKIKELK